MNEHIEALVLAQGLTMNPSGTLTAGTVRVSVCLGSALGIREFAPTPVVSTGAHKGAPTLTGALECDKETARQPTGIR